MSDRKKESEPNTKRKDNDDDGTESSKANTLDGGVTAFGEWLRSAEDPGARCGPLSVRKIVNDEQVVLFDAILGQEVTVRMIDGVPNCNTCHDPDCMHVGFSICVAQMNRRS